MNAASAEAPTAGASRPAPSAVVAQAPTLDRTTDDGPDLLEDLDQALGAGPSALGDARPEDAADDDARSAPAAPAPGALENPAETEIDAPFW